MTHAGRNLLYRVETRCAEEYGRALARVELNSVKPGNPFEFIAWHHAIYIVHRLRWGRSLNKPLGGGLR